MAGYQDHSKSNNAIAAEECGFFPATTLAKKLGVKTAAVKAIMEPEEWHHTSAWYNQTMYYDGAVMLGLDEDADDDDVAEAADLLARLRAWQPATTGRQWTGCKVKWLVWGGRRSRPIAIEQSANDCKIEWKGSTTCVVTFSDGTTMRRRTSARGFLVWDAEGILIRFSAGLKRA